MAFGRVLLMPFDRPSMPPKLQVDYERGTALLRDDDVLAALPLLERAAARRGDDCEALLYLTWARARASDSSGCARARSDAVHHARRALKEGRAGGLALCVLGHAAVERGDLRAARDLFRRASAADRTLVDARRQLLLVSRRIEETEKSPGTAWAGQVVAKLVTRVASAFRP
jgi:hypothetical protein